MIYINFHGVGDCSRVFEQDEEKVWVSIEKLEFFLDRIKGKAGLFITVDDGNSSDADVILPALLDRGMKGSFFVLAGKIDQPGYLSKSSLKEMAEAGMKIGSHGMNHCDLRTLNDERLRQEVLGSKDCLEGIVGNEVAEFACPFGSYSRRVLTALKKAQYSKVFTSDRGVAMPGQWLVPRNTLHSFDTVESLGNIIDQPSMCFNEFIRRAKSSVKRWR